MPTLFDERAEDDLTRQVRRAVDSVDFDHPALVFGVHRRARRLSRRRAIVTGAGLLLLAPVLAGALAVLPALSPAGIPDAAPPGVGADLNAGTHNAGTPQASTVAGQTASVDRAPESAQRPPESSPRPPESSSRPPESSSRPPESTERPLETNPDYPNAWEIPDLRPGLAGLDALGDPLYAAAYPRTVPVDRLMSCDPGRPGGAEPLAGLSFMYQVQDGPSELPDLPDLPEGSLLSLHVTGWADSTAARDGLVHDNHTLCTWDAGWGAAQSVAQPWPGRADDPDHLLLVHGGAGSSGAQSSGAGLTAAVVRQGDYLVAVTVDGITADSVEVATRIADGAAAGLAALDPAHGTD